MDNPFEKLDHKLDSLSDKVDMLKNQVVDQIPRKEILTIEEVVDYTGLKQSTILKHRKSGKLLCHKQGGRLYFPLTYLIEWLTEHQTDRRSREDYKKSREKVQERRRQEAHENLKK